MNIKYFIVNLDSNLNNLRLCNSLACSPYLSKLPKILLSNAPPSFLLKKNKINFLNWLKNLKNLIHTVFKILIELKILSSSPFTPLKGRVILIHWINKKDKNLYKIINCSNYFGVFIKDLNDKKNVSLLGHIVDGNNDFKEIAQEKIHFIKNNIRYIDVIWAFLLNFSLLFNFKKILFNNLDYSVIIKKALVQEFWDGTFLKNLLFYKAFLRIFKQLPENTKIVYPFENQPWEKAMLMARRKSEKNIILYAYQFFPIAENFLIYQFSEQEKEKKWLPDFILTSDSYSNNLFEKQNIKTIKLGNMRYHRLLNKTLESKEKKDTIICALSFDPTESKNLVELMLKISFETNAKIIINYHKLLPQNEVNEIRSMIINYNNSVSLSSKTAADLLESAFLLIYNESSVFLDAALRGVPTLYLSYPGGINMDRFHGFGKTVQNAQEAIDFIRKLQSQELFYREYAKHVHSQANKLIYAYNHNVVEEILS